MNGNGRAGRLGPEFLLRASEYFLRDRNFVGCRKYALQAQESNPGNAAAAQIIAVVDVLAASEIRFNNNRPDWYAILGVDRYSGDSQLIRNRFKNLILLLNPNKNKFAFADDAFELVRGAWTVLSNPSKKTQFDIELKIFESQAKTQRREDSGGKMEGEGGETFWTVCPYCYYVYEYPRVYEECCLRCQNQNCRRGFHAAEIPTPPPAAVVSNGQYWCLGFYPIGFVGGERKGFSSWTPFAPMFMGTPQEDEEVVEEKNAVPQGGNGSKSNGDSFNEISDDGDNPSGDEFMGKSKETLIEVNGEKVQTDEVKKGGESIHGRATKADETEVPTVTKPVMKRKKTVAKNTKKIMGKGIRIKKNETNPGHDEGPDLNADARKGEENFWSGIAGGMEMGIGGDSAMDRVEFFEEEDNIFVGLHDGF